jgi:predicted nucleotidyltransferase
MMTDSDSRILRELAMRLRGVYPTARLWAFGSRARGDAEPDSDFDVCVVMPTVSDEDRRRIRHIAWEVAFEHGTVFNTVILSEEEFERGPMSESTLVSNVLREGVAA